MNLQVKLEQSLNDVLRTAGYMYEVMNSNKRLTNLVSGPNTQPINPAIAAQLSSCLYRFDDVLDETIGKFNDARWCVEQMLESKQRQEESKQQELKREEERTKQLQKEEEARKLQSQQQEKFREEQARQNRETQEAESKRALEMETERQQQQQQQRQQQPAQNVPHQDSPKKTSPEQWSQSSPQDQLQHIYKHAQMQNHSSDTNAAPPAGHNRQADSYSSPSFNFGMNFEPQNDAMLDPSNIISSLPYDESVVPDMVPAEAGQAVPTQGQDVDLDMDNLLGNDELILDGLNMAMLDQGYDMNNNTTAIDADFDVDSFLNQYGGE